MGLAGAITRFNEAHGLHFGGLPKSSAAGVIDQKLDHKEVLEVGARVKDSMIELLRRVMPRLQ